MALDDNKKACCRYHVTWIDDFRQAAQLPPGHGILQILGQ